MVFDTKNSKELFLALLKADSEDEITNILRKWDVFDNDKYWRTLGDSSTNYSITGGQQSTPEAALKEKIVNAEDAILEGECLKRRIDPTSPQAPQSMKNAMELFFDIPKGDLRNIDSEKRGILADRIKLIATGKKTNPCFTVVDSGLGQTPDGMVDTLLSIPGAPNKDAYKKDKPFLQGIYNMGGTGAFRFCGKVYNYQLIISRRDPALLANKESLFGFTIIRRNNPRPGAKESSVYQYLAPNQKISRFSADNIVLPYEVKGVKPIKFEYGTCIKLYEYDITQKTIVTQDLRRELNRQFYEMALPVRIIEGRDYKGHTFSSVLAGMTVRLAEEEDDIDDRDDSENRKKDPLLEEGFPLSYYLNIPETGRVKLTVYAFVDLDKGKDKSKDKKSQTVDRIVGGRGVIYVINGQMHGSISTQFFTRKEVGLSYLEDHLMVIVDCSDFDGRIRENTFMADRERLSKSIHKTNIEAELAKWLKINPTIRDLADTRQAEFLKKEVGDDKYFKEIMSQLIKYEPELRNIISFGQDIIKESNFKYVKRKGPYKGKEYPTFFRLEKGKPKLTIKLPLKSFKHVIFETDANDDYFDRENNPGRIFVENKADSYLLRGWDLKSGLCQCIFRPLKNSKVGQKYNTTVVLRDKKNTFRTKVQILIVKEEIIMEKEEDEHEPKGPLNPIPPVPPKEFGRIKVPIEEDGKGGQKEMWAIPNMRWVYREKWHEFNFNENSGLQIKTNNGKKDVYINGDNKFLRKEISLKKEPVELLRVV
ncbi:MAG: hypothetical protein L0H53_03980 [Candidatus Nitrosocosmicus sp.]|nr:hypothetical protein [Candidatus Nitrosocosmicus sp.]MDN5867801.1 hypothetical protein [Candidatus Nitrosocosmicus sp.]